MSSNVQWLAGKSKIEVQLILQQLGFTLNQNQKSSNKISMLCPYHGDASFGNAFLYMPSGVFVCKSCHVTRPIPNMVMDLKACNRDDALKTLNIDSALMSIMEDTLPSLKSVPKKKKRREAYFDPAYSDLILSDLDPDKYAYTRERGYTEEFIRHFNIKLCSRGYLKDYMIIPLPDVSPQDYEARKVSEREVIERITGEDTSGMTSKEVRGLITSFNFPEDLKASWEERYLLHQPRVKYRNNSIIHTSLFQESKLDRSQALYVAEGTGSLPRIWKDVSQNVTCIFGASLAPEQVEMLMKFSEVYLIPDGDPASDKMLRTLATISDVFKAVLLPPGVTDTHPDFSSELLSAPHLTIGEYFHERVKKTPPLF